MRACSPFSPSFTRFAQRLTYQIGVDFIFHKRDTYKMGNDSVFDLLWATSSGSFGLWLVQNKDSEFLLRQIASAGFHVARLGYTLGFSFLDLALCSIAGRSRDASVSRAINRVMYVLKRNGGVYADLGVLVANFGCMSHFKAFHELNNEEPPDKDSELIVKKIFESETGKSFSDIFSSITLQPNEWGTVISHSAVLQSGQEVAITVVKPNVARMRFLDMLPLRIFQGIVNLIPMIPCEKALVNQFVRRLDFSISREIAMREFILTKFGVDIDGSPEDVIDAASRAPTPLFISPPLRGLCGRHVMVTGPIGQRIDKMTHSHVRRIATAFSDFTFKHNLAIGNWSRANVRESQDGLTLLRFCGAATFNPDSLTEVLRATSGWVAHDFGVSGGARTRQAVAKCAGIVGIAEGIACIENARREAGAMPTVMEPVFAGLSAKMIGPGMSHSSLPFGLVGWLKYF